MPRDGRFTQQVERAALDLRCGLPVAVRGLEGLRLVASLDGLTPARFEEMRAGASGPIRLILNQHRLSHLGLEAPSSVAAIALEDAGRLTDMNRLAMEPDVGRLPRHTISPATEAEAAALVLLRRGLLMPAALAVTPGEAFFRTLESRLARDELLSVAAADVFAHCEAAPRLRRLSEATVPLEGDRHSRFVVFRETRVLRQHVAVLIGHRARWPAPVPVRVHSGCLTGDLFGSLRCDCGSQLRKSVGVIAGRGGGVLLYLAQEGRGIGLANKLRAYRLQDTGLDTVDADRALGFDDDERQYAVAREMLTQLDVTHIDLLTNNPGKLEGLNQNPIRVARRSSLYGRLTKENRGYLLAKAERSGHWLDELLREASETPETDRVDRA